MCKGGKRVAGPSDCIIHYSFHFHYSVSELYLPSCRDFIGWLFGSPSAFISTTLAPSYIRDVGDADTTCCPSLNGLRRISHLFSPSCSSAGECSDLVDRWLLSLSDPQNVSPSLVAVRGLRILPFCDGSVSVQANGEFGSIDCSRGGGLETYRLVASMMSMLCDRFLPALKCLSSSLALDNATPMSCSFSCRSKSPGCLNFDWSS